MSRDPGPLEGTLLGGAYRVGRLVGEGTMGAVYEGTQEGLGRPVAIKVLKARGGASANDLERFGREARAAAALGHPNIVQVTDFRADSDPPFLVMERLSGESMRAVIAREKRLSVTRVALLGSQILDALAAAHRGGIVHRDIKPDNVFITRIAGGTEVVKVLDFGVAKLTTDRPITAFGALMGSPAYMAPEQATGKTVDARTDLWAVGATLYHALAGKLPFDADSMAELVTWLLDRPPTPLTSLVPGLDPRMVAVIERALTKDPGGRFANAAEMQAALEALAASPAAVPVAAAFGGAQGSSPSLPRSPSAPDMLGGNAHAAPRAYGSSPALPPQQMPSAPDFSRASTPGSPLPQPQRHPSAPDFSRASTPGSPLPQPQRHPSAPDFSRASTPGSPLPQPQRHPSAPDFSRGSTPMPVGTPLGGFGPSAQPLGRPMPVGVPLAVGVAPPVAESEPRLSHPSAPRISAPSAARIAATAPMAAHRPTPVPMHTPLPSSAQAYGQMSHAGEFRGSYPGPAPRPPSHPGGDERASHPGHPSPPEPATRPRSSGRGWLFLLLLPAFLALAIVLGVLAWLYYERSNATDPATSPAPSASGPSATGLPAGWKKKVDAPHPCTALRIAPYENGKTGTFAHVPDAEGQGLGSQLAAKIGACTQGCVPPKKDERYLVRVAYDGTVTEARYEATAGDASKCDARDLCVDTAMRSAKLDAPPNAQESIVEISCTFP